MVVMTMTTGYDDDDCHDAVGDDGASMMVRINNHKMKVTRWQMMALLATATKRLAAQRQGHVHQRRTLH